MNRKYAPLCEHLAGRKESHVSMRFAEIERLIAAPLPPSARKHRPWWSNNPSNSVITHAWLDAGFRTESVDMAGETLVFRRAEPASGGKRAAASVPGAQSATGTGSLDGLHGGLRGTGYVPPGADIVAPVWDWNDWKGE